MKEYLKSMLKAFFMLVTLISVAMFILGMIFEPNRKFGYEGFLFPLIYGLLGTLPMVITYSKRELSLKQMIVRHIIQFFVIELVIVTFVLLNGMSDLKAIVAMMLSILVICIVVNVLEWMLDKKTSEVLTVQLRKYQESKKDE